MHIPEGNLFSQTVIKYITNNNSAFDKEEIIHLYLSVYS